MSPAQAQELVDDAPGLSQYTKPMQDLIRRAAAQGEDGTYFVSSAHTRLVNGARSKNPRYLQLRPDLANPYEVELARWPPTSTTRCRWMSRCVKRGCGGCWSPQQPA